MKTILTYILLLATVIAFSQKDEKSAQKDKEIEIATETKNFIRKGNKLYQEGNYANAQKEYAKAMQLNPSYDKANYNFGNTQFLQNKVKEAKEQYELVSKTTKDKFIKADAQHNIGNIAMKDKKYQEAVNAYKESMRNNPNDDETRYNLALAQKLLKGQEKKDKDKDKDDKDKKDKKDKDKKDDKNKKDNDKDKDKKDDKKKDKDKDKKDDKKDDKDKKDNDKNKKDKEDGKQKPKPKPSKLSPEQVKQLLEAMNKEENKTQKKMNAKKVKGKKVKQEKDW